MRNKEFKTGREYVTAGGEIKVTKRAAHYVTYTDGRETRKVKIRKDHLFGGHEYILVPSDYPDMNYICVASDVIGVI